MAVRDLKALDMVRYVAVHGTVLTAKTDCSRTLLNSLYETDRFLRSVRLRGPSAYRRTVLLGVLLTNYRKKSTTAGLPSGMA